MVIYQPITILNLLLNIVSNESNHCPRHRSQHSGVLQDILSFRFIKRMRILYELSGWHMYQF
jgi:hypothetical protein